LTAIAALPTVDAPIVDVSDAKIRPRSQLRKPTLLEPGRYPRSKKLTQFLRSAHLVRSDGAAPAGRNLYDYRSLANSSAAALRRSFFKLKDLSGRKCFPQCWWAQCWFALRVAVWLCCLPILLRLHSLPALLRHLTHARARRRRRSSLDMNQAVSIVVRLCNLRLFRLPVFPQACLRQSLALYCVLTRMGYRAEIHFGVAKNGADLRGHSWVMVEGDPVAERAPTEAFRPIYSFPSVGPTHTTERAVLNE
jgi:Transglutaminase-like superfamily